jgi:hypothetical protein
MTQTPAQTPSIENIRARRKPVSEPREFDRTPLTLHGIYSLDGDKDRSCVVLDVSPGGACVMAAEIPAMGTQIKLNITSLGIIEGKVVRCTDIDFSVKFSTFAQKPGKLAVSIARHFNCARLGLIDRTIADGASGTNEASQHSLILPDGRRLDTEIMDISLAGVAYTSDTAPDLGATVRVGSLTGTVIRHLENGFAVTFDPPEDVSKLPGTRS